MYIVLILLSTVSCAIHHIKYVICLEQCTSYKRIDSILEFSYIRKYLLDLKIL